MLNPAILLLIAVVAGAVLYDKVNLHAPLLEKITGLRKEAPSGWDFIKSGIIGGAIAGDLITLLAGVYEVLLPNEFIKLGEGVQTPVLVRFLYGGITEEILMRYGLMTFLVWVIFKMLNGNLAYWTGIILAAIIFAIGHFPVVFNSIDDPSLLLLTYILIGNATGGIVFGWLYWKKGLESAMVAHFFAHVVMLWADYVFG